MSSPYYPRTLRYDAPESEALYKATLEKTGCSTAADSLQCLKTIDVRKLQKAAFDLVGNNKHTVSTFTWIPVIDGSFLIDTLSEAVAKKRINTEAAWGLYNAHEGENFIPDGFKNATGLIYNSTEISFDSWIQGFMPRFNASVLSELKTVYPALGESETFGYDTNDLKAGLLYRDVAISCPGLWVAKGATRVGYMSEYTIAPARHASDVAFVSQLQLRLLSLI
jgi:carboxylesterase type B